MKRDARIGLAVVLVLGLSVTLLIGRALYKTNDQIAESDAGSDASASGSEVARVDGAQNSALTAAAAESRHSQGGPIIEIPETGSTGSPGERANPGMQRFVDDQTRQLNPVQAPVQSGGMPSSAQQFPPDALETGSAPRTPRGGERPRPPVPDAPDEQDHERGAQPANREAAPPAEGLGYTVAAGDNIWKISSKVYGDGKYTQKILQANSGLDANKLKVGSVIKIPLIPNKTVLMRLPSFTEATGGQAARAPEAVANARRDAPNERPAEAARPVATEHREAVGESGGQAATHKVESGETLAGIAKKHYGFSGPKSVARIVEANPGLNPAKLKVGQELVIPAKK